MSGLDRASRLDLLKSALAEAAKGRNETKCALEDLTCAIQDTTTSLKRYSFIIMMLNQLIDKENKGD